MITTVRKHLKHYYSANIQEITTPLYDMSLYFINIYLPIGLKFCVAVRPDLGQVFSYFGWGMAPGMAKFWASTGAMWRDMLLAEAFV